MRQQFERLAKNTLTYGAGRVLTRLINFFLLPLFTSYLTSADFGIISILGLIALVTTPVFSLGLGAAVGTYYFEGNNKERKEATIWTAFGFLILSTLILAVSGVALARLISLVAFQTPEYHYLVRVSLLSTSLSILATPFMLYLQFEERAKLFVALTVLSTLTSIGMNILMVVILREGVQGMIEGGAFAQAITFVLFLLPAVRNTRIRLSYELGKELLRLGVPLIPSFAFLFVLQQANKYFLQRFDGLEASGIYLIGFNFGGVMSLLVTGFSNAWMPFFMSFIEKKEQARLLFGRILTYYVFGVGALSLLFYIAAKPVVMIMTTPSFHDAYTVVGFSATAQFLVGVFNIFLPGVYFAKEVKYVSLVQAVAAMTAVGLNLLLIPSLHVLGAGIVLVVGYLVMAILQYLLNLKRGYLAVQYEWGRILRFSLIYIGYVVLMLWQRNLPLSVEVIIAGSAATSVVVTSYFLLSKDERRMLWKMVKQVGYLLQGRALLKTVTGRG